MNTQKKKCDDATRKRLEEARLKGLETRRMKAELKKHDKEAEKEKLRQAYEQKVLKKTASVPAPKAEEETEETEEEIYRNQPTAGDDSASDSDIEEEPTPVKAKATPKPKATTLKKPPTKSLNSIGETPMNYKQEYYRMKMMKLQQQDQQAQYMHSYSQMPPQQHMIDIAKSQLQSKVNRELMSRVYNDLFQC